MTELPINPKIIRDLAAALRHRNIYPLYAFVPTSQRFDKILSKKVEVAVEETIQLIRSTTKEEIKKIVNALPPWCRMRLNPDDVDLIGDDLAVRRIANVIITYQIHRIYLDFSKIISQNSRSNIVVKTYPEIFKDIDDDGLLKIDFSKYRLTDNGILFKDHVLQYSQFLRRGFTSNPNFDFFAKFIPILAKNQDSCFGRVAIDFDRLMPIKNFVRSFEHDSWYGPKFSRKDIDDPHSHGLTVFTRNAKIGNLGNYDLKETEFLWSVRENLKTFQIEEISSENQVFDGFKINRYFHSIRDIAKKTITHLDGAVKIYDSSYYKRLATRMPNEQKALKYIKTFRIDGSIKLEDWIEVACFYFKGNEMVPDYFSEPGKEV